MANLNIPDRAVRQQIASAVNLIVQVNRIADGTRKITSIAEITGMETDVITMQDLFTFNYGAGRDENGRFRGSLVSTGLRPKFTDELHDQGIDLPPDLFVRGM
jgi:pilus assembly protein CpaF